MSIGNYSGAISPSGLGVPPYFYTRVTAGSPGGKTTLHAVLDYDDDLPLDYPDLEGPQPLVDTSDQGPIAVRGNGSVPVVPVYSYGTQQSGNGSLVHIPTRGEYRHGTVVHQVLVHPSPRPPPHIQRSSGRRMSQSVMSYPANSSMPLLPVDKVLWTALSLALGLEIRGDVIRGTPCIKKHHQLFCPTAGNTYPIDRIELFIDENKALIKRMYGEFENRGDYPGSAGPGEEVYEEQRRGRRQAPRPSNHTSESGRVDSCQSKIEIVTPYWAANSAGKIRAIVNTQHFEQAIHQEVCSKVQTHRCAGDCGCEQKHKWHRLLAYDPDNDCKGIFMDWFLFPSCCVCRCNPSSTPSRHRA